MKQLYRDVIVWDSSRTKAESCDLVTDNGGGHGAVRELVNHILHKKGILERAVMSYLEESSCFDTQ